MIYNNSTLTHQKLRRNYPFSLCILLISSVLSFYSCGKKTSNIKGTNSLIYESQFYSSLNDNLEALTYISTIEVTNAKPQEQMYGSVYQQGQSSSSNGKSMIISNVSIADIKVSDVYLSSVYNIDSLENYISSGKLILRYIDANGTKVDKELASYASIDRSAKKVLFTEVTDDLTSFCKNNPSILLFVLTLKNKPINDIILKYHVALDYNYSYDEKESK